MRSGLRRILFPGLLTLGLAAAVVWMMTEPAAPPTVPAPLAAARVSTKFVFPPALASSASSSSTPTTPNRQSAIGNRQSADRLHPTRLRNTAEPYAKLLRDDHAILMANALIDSAAGRGLDIPDAWKSEGDPRAYLVQSAGKTDDEFRAKIAAAGGAIVSYIPNNAYLVRMDATAAAGLSAAGGVQAVLPYEPYYKVDEQLLNLTAAGQGLPPETNLKLVFFADEAQQGLEQARQAGAVVVGQDSTPFGPAVVVQPPADGWVGLAKLESIQWVERSVRGRLMNDLVRVALGIATNSQIGVPNYLGLSGTNVMISLNDSGVDASHPDLANRIFSVSGGGTNLVDYVGHGTHTAGIMAGSGSLSSSVTSANVPGSAANADFRGAAPAANIFILPIDLANGPFISNAYLQTNAAGTNALLSNNSWGFPGVNTYDSAAASFDAAVRDALPQTPGMQPMVYVFSAGNAGNAAQDGTGGDPGSISSPATAKNVITVGASENFRNITNSVVTTNSLGQPSTNEVYAGWTQDPTQIAFFSSRGNVGIGVEGDFGRFKPDVVAPGTFVASTRSAQWQFANDYSPLSPTYPVDVFLDGVFGPRVPAPYRFDSGTSMAAPAVTGVLALMQEFFEQRLKVTNSPALYKALLINGARSLGSLYDFQVETPINSQGWGMVNLTNSVPSPLTNAPSTWPMQFLDQSAANALGTDQSRTWVVNLSTNNGAAQGADLKFTLVWTDPPGNPAAGVKLVNDLDLIVTNLTTMEVMAGNDFAAGSLVTQPLGTNDVVNGTNAVSDVVNNVENVYLSPVSGPLAASYSVTVTAKRVNVNAVTGHPNGVVQDFALVVASGNPAAQISLTAAGAAVNPAPFVTVATNGVPLLNQRAGANSPLIGGTNGTTNQWAFYVFSNTVANGSNVAFATFFPPNLAVPRNQSADLDMYVSTDSSLTNLNPTAVAGSIKSLNRNGTQSVIFINEPAGKTYYVGIKAEDQQGGQFGFFAIASATPFSSQDPNGNIIITGTQMNQPIPDGNLTRPGRALIFGFSTSEQTIRRVTVTNSIYHELFGDLIDVLTLNGSEPVFLLNHNLSAASGQQTFVFDDVQTYDLGGPGLARHTDGPGTLTSYVGQQAAGLWLLDVEDDVPVHTGIVNQLTIRVEPRLATNILTAVIPPGQFFYDFVSVPANATNLTVDVQSPQGPVEVFLAPGSLPTLTNFVKTATIDPTGSLSLGLNDSPPLTPGIWFIGFFNPNPFTITVNYEVILGLELTAAGNGLFAPSGPMAILDDAHTLSAVTVTNASAIFSLNVAVRIDHPRVSDLVLRLTSPSGKTVLLAENRGGASGTGYGVSLDGTNASQIIYTVFTEDTNLTTTPIKFGIAPFTNGPAVIGLVTNGPPTFQNGFDRATVGQKYPVGTVLDGWTVVSNTVSIFGNGLGFFGPSDTGANCLNINGETPGAVTTSFPTVVGRSYNVSFAYTHSPQGGASLARFVLTGQSYGDLTNTTLYSAVLNNFSVLNWQHASYSFVADSTMTTIELIGLNPGPDGMFFDSFSVFGTVPVSGGPYLPEEPLSLFQGDSAYGLWTLDVLDDRVGPANGSPAPELLDWQLLFTFTPTNFPATPLFEGATVTNTVLSSNEVFFAVNVPGAATAATNILTSLTASGGGLNLWFNQSGLPGFNPDGTPTAGSFELLTGTAQGTAVLVTNGLPPLLEPGQEYYLGVMNSNPNGSNTFTLTVNFDRLFYQDAIIPLVNGVPLTTNIAATNALEYFVYNVSTNAKAVEFQITSPGGQVDLVASYQTLPIANVFDYQSTNPGPSQIITVTAQSPQSSLVPIQPGLWYLGVYNPGNTPVTYTIEASEVTSLSFAGVTLTNGVPYAGYVTNADTAEFIVYAPPGALFGTNTLVTLDGQGVVLWFDQTNPPTGGLAGDFLLFGTTTGDTFLMDTGTTTPFFEPGVPYYLGVQGLNPTLTNRFLLTVNFDNLYFGSVGVPILTNAVTLFTNIPPGSGLQYFEYETGTASYGPGTANANGPEISGPYDAIFQVLGGGAGLQLFISAYPAPLPVPGAFDFTGTLAGGSNSIFVSAPNYYPSGGSLPQPLEPSQLWYVGVLNTTTNTVSYGVRVDESDVIPPTPPWEVLPDVVVSNGFFNITWNSTIGFTYYVQGKPDLADPGWFTISPPIVASNAVTTYEVPITIPLRFFRVATNTVTGALLPTGLIFPTFEQIPLTNGVSFSNTVIGGGEMQYYVFDVATNATTLTFNTASGEGSMYFLVSKDILPGNNSFDYSSAAYSGNATQEVVIATSSQPVPLSPGPWYVAVGYPILSNAASYTIVANEFPPPSTNGPPTNAGPQFIALQNGVPYTTNVTAPALFFEFAVPTNSTEAVFDLLAPSSPALLLVKSGSPPSLTNFDYAVTNAGAAVLFTNSSPPLAAGEWYLGVFGLSTTNLTFTVQAQAQVSALVINPGLSISNNTLNLSWPSIPGYTYYVQGKTNLTDTTWQDVSMAILATGTTTSYGVSTTLPYHYFRIIGYAPGPGSGSGFTINPQVSLTTNQFDLSWASIIGDTYYVQGKTNLTDTSWLNVSPAIVATNTTTSYGVPISLPYHYFRIVEYPPGSASTGSTNFLINPQVQVTSTNLTLSWNSVPGDLYSIQGKTNLLAASWSPVVGPIDATSTVTSASVPLGSGFSYFRIVQNLPAGASTNFLISPQITLTTNTFTLSWVTIPGDQYTVQGKTNILDTVWQPVAGPFFPTGTSYTNAVSTSLPWRFFRIEQVP